MTDQACDWPLDPACSYGVEPDPDKRTPEEAAAVAAATDLLWRLTAGTFGLCEETVRPCRGGCAQQWLTFPPRGVPPDLRSAGGPALVGGQWLNIPCGCGLHPCSCGPLCEVALPGPVQEIVQVLQDGAVVPGSAYRVDNWQWLVRTDGACWPACQDMAATATKANTWAVTYLRGNIVPPGGRRAVGALSAELLKACGAAPGACRLPANAVQVVREGVTLTMDTTAMLDAGRTGLPEADLWLSAVNPNNLRSRPAVFSPDLPGHREMSYPLPAPFTGAARGAGDGL